MGASSKCVCLHSVTCALLLAAIQLHGLRRDEVSFLPYELVWLSLYLVACLKRAVNNQCKLCCCLTTLELNSAGLVCISLCLGYRQQADMEQQLQQERQHLFAVAQAVQIANSHQLTVNAAVTQCKDQIGAYLHR